MSLVQKLLSRIFSKKPVHVKTDNPTLKRFEVNTTTFQVSKVMSAVITHKKIKHNPKLQYSKKKSQNKNWTKWRVSK